MKNLKTMRAELVIAEYNSYSPDNFPGSVLWTRNNNDFIALKEFDLAHPEIKSAVEAEHRAKRKKDYDAMGDFIKAGS